MKRMGFWIFCCGAIITVISVSMGNALQAELKNMSVEAFVQQQGTAGWMRFLLFAFGFPLGVGGSLLGLLIGSGTSCSRFLLLAGVVAASVLAAGLVPVIFGRELSALFFGGGGYSIMLLVFAVLWYWGRLRSNLPQTSRLAADLQAAGYLCFAAAAWNLCGVATMPAFALEPEKMLAMNAQSFAIGQMKTIMVLFIIGWLFTLLGLRQAASSAADRKKSDDTQQSGDEAEPVI